MIQRERSDTPGFNADLRLKGFKVFKTGGEADSGHSYSRKDFYKINVSTGKFRFHYADRSFEVDETFRFFGNPRIPYSCELLSPTHNGYTCVFSEEFLKANDRSESLLNSPLFNLGGTPVLQLNELQKATVYGIFEKMLAEQESSYAFKDDVIRNYIYLLAHEAMKSQPSEEASPKKNAATRIASVFLELLERQFPIESKDRPLELKTAKDFARVLSVHVNYLNSAVKDVTGKTTTGHIAERITHEAKALLQHTDWNISEIAYALGFEYPTYFNNFFKKNTGQIPKSLRSEHL
jgi:AraC family transcriptional activator of pobA